MTDVNTSSPLALKPRHSAIVKNKLTRKVIQIKRVTKVVKGGRNLSFQAVIVIGDKKGTVGVGKGKAKDTTNAIRKAEIDAKKNLIKINITNSSSISAYAEGQEGAAKIFMKPARKGSGVIAGSSIRTVLESAGIKNIIAKQYGSGNLLNNAKATINALIALKSSTYIKIDQIGLGLHT